MSITATMGSVGNVRNTSLKNELLVIEITKAFIDTLEFLQGELLGKMDGDRQKTDVLKERLKWQQNAVRGVTDQDGNDRIHILVLTFDPSDTPPFSGMQKMDTSKWPYPDQDLSSQENLKNIGFGMGVAGMTLRQFLAAGGSIWNGQNGAKVTGKQLFTYCDQQAEYSKSAISSLNSITSQDNLTLQSLRSKIESVTQFLSTLMKNGYDIAAGVLRNFPG